MYFYISTWEHSYFLQFEKSHGELAYYTIIVSYIYRHIFNRVHRIRLHQYNCIVVGEAPHNLTNSIPIV